ncbi:hypothetical protein O181_043716 [Austropuccinia psidii MF-1]|uniref:Retrovirus-related Pol polyprotein from transposon TNT 1-94-like beta-barrel domain-containing protein n=1 Tax=Austropuccinia psidii MF-1 TaxID=1389203 RepID=A0A9Q3DH61_9BASI|nr:hypothetical protein [Austropuccinia psidii MF-1]
MNEEIIEIPNLILNQLKEYVNNLNTKGKYQRTSSALVSVSDHPYKITYYCANGCHKIKCTTHTKEEFYTEHPHLRPPRQENKINLATSNKPSPSLLLSYEESLETFASEPSSHQRLVIDCGATHNMFNNEKYITELSISNDLRVETGDPHSSPLSKEAGMVSIIGDGRRLLLDSCLFVPKLNCNLIIFLKLFSEKLTMV